MGPRLRRYPGPIATLLLLLAIATAASGSILVDRGEHANYDVQMPETYTEPPHEILNSISRSCPQCRVLLGQNVIGYVSLWDPSQTVVWTPFRAGVEDDAFVDFDDYDDFDPNRDPLIPEIPDPDDPPPSDASAPEPATFLLAGAALAILAARRGALVRR